MHLHFLDPYQPRLSPLHRLDARVKLVLVLSFILTASLAPVGSWAVYLLLVGISLSAVVLSQLGFGYVLKRSLLAVPFVLAAVPVIFTLEGQSLLEFSLGNWNFTVTQPGLERFLSIAIKSWVSVQAAILLSASTPFPDLLIAMRAVRIPRLMVAIFGLMWRYLFVLGDEALRMLRARASRSGHSEQPGRRTGGSLAWRGRVAGGMAGSLFLRAIERSDRIYMAMVARGYDGEVRAVAQPRLSHLNWLVLWAGLALLGLILSIGFFL